jgi:hypothetical protein
MPKLSLSISCLERLGKSDISPERKALGETRRFDMAEISGTGLCGMRVAVYRHSYLLYLQRLDLSFDNFTSNKVLSDHAVCRSENSVAFESRVPTVSNGISCSICLKVGNVLPFVFPRHLKYNH